jgi:hypothetical protein
MVSAVFIGLSSIGEGEVNFAYASIVGSYADGYDDGKAAADNTYNSGGTRDASCPAGHSFTYCLGYHYW